MEQGRLTAYSESEMRGALLPTEKATQDHQFEDST